MSTVGIIAEYNPFHNGHLYHLKKSKEISKSSNVVVIMSGAFTQSGNIAIYDKFDRAKMAINSGADIVIELPVIYSNSSANYFAFGAINILNNLGIIDNICFGAECDNIHKLKEIVSILLNYDTDIQNEISKYLKVGNSFAVSRDKALNKYLTSNQIDILRSPNNILGIEYLKNLNLLNSKINPHIVTRTIPNFNDTILSKKDFSSATSIRNYIYENYFNYTNSQNNLEILKNHVPLDVLNIITSSKPTFNDELFNILKYKMITSNLDDIKNIFEVTEGLENKIIKEINNSKNYDEFTKNIKSKRYQLSKIKRMLINILLDITDENFKFAYNNKISYAHILACSENGKKLLSDISKKSNIDIITSINNISLDKLSKNTKDYLMYDIKAENIYSILNNQNINKDYTNRL